MKGDDVGRYREASVGVSAIECKGRLFFKLAEDSPAYLPKDKVARCSDATKTA